MLKRDQLFPSPAGERPVLQEGGIFSQNPSPGGSDMDGNEGKKMLVEAGPKGLGFIPKICSSLSGLGDIGCIPVLSKLLWPWGVWELFNGTRNSLEFWDQTSGCCWRGGSTALLGDRALWWPRQRWVHSWTGGTPRSFPTGIIPGLCGEIAAFRFSPPCCAPGHVGNAGMMGARVNGSAQPVP